MIKKKKELFYQKITCYMILWQHITSLRIKLYIFTMKLFAIIQKIKFKVQLKSIKIFNYNKIILIKFVLVNIILIIIQIYMKIKILKSIT